MQYIFYICFVHSSIAQSLSFEKPFEIAVGRSKNENEKRVFRFFVLFLVYLFSFVIGLIVDWVILNDVVGL